MHVFLATLGKGLKENLNGLRVFLSEPLLLCHLFIRNAAVLSIGYCTHIGVSSIVNTIHHKKVKQAA